MTRIIGVGLTGLLATLSFLLSDAPSAGAGVKPSTVRIGVIRSLFRDTPEPVMQVVMAPFRSLLEVQTGMTGQLIPGGDAHCLAGKLKDENVHFGVFHGVEFAWARLKCPDLKPLVVCVNGNGHLQAQLLVRKDSNFKAVADLKGQTVALPRFSREHCRLFLEHRCTPPAETSFYSQVARPQDPEEALDDLCDGHYAAAVVDMLALEAYRKYKPGCANRLRAVLESEVFPPAVLAYQPGVLADETLHRFKEGMITANSTARGRKMLELCRITAFQPVPENYDAMLATIVKAYPPPAK